MTPIAPAPRAPGRPRSERADQAIVRATLELIAEEGFAGLSVEAVASRAGVGKATIYRRFSCRDVLVAEALATLNDDLPAVVPGPTTRDTLVAVLESMQRSRATLSGLIMNRVIGEASANPGLVQTFYERVVAARRDRMRAVLQAGVAAGELRDDVDVDVMTTVLVGSVLYNGWWAASGAGPAPVPPADIVDAALAGIGRAV